MTESPSTIELAGIPAFTWRLLQAGVESASNPFHTACLATLSDEGPTQRTVVLRHIDGASRRLVCHTDVRSAKAKQVQENPRASWLFYDAGAKLQLRFGGRLTMHTNDELADIRWAASTPSSRACYHTESRPGHLVDAPPAAPSVSTDETAMMHARRHFAVLACQIETLDWLFLSREGHRRAQFGWSDDGMTAHWVAP